MNSKPTFKCAKCHQHKVMTAFHNESRIQPDRVRPVPSWCKDCRSDNYFKKTAPGQICAQCLRPRRIDQNKICGACNEESGLRQCRRCGDLLLLHLDFYGSRRVCITCSTKPKQPA